MTTITVNGKTIRIDGNASNVCVSNGRVTVGGVDVVTGLQGIVKIVWDGPLASLHADTAVECGDVQGDVDGGNSVSCRNVKGSVKAGNSVVCGSVGGNVKAGNSVIHS